VPKDIEFCVTYTLLNHCDDQVGSFVSLRRFWMKG